MRYLLALFILVLASTPAFAANESRAFPPDNCTTASPFMGFTGVNGSNTFCNSGQDVLNNAIPTCLDGQKVVRENGKFICKSDAAVPSCTPNEFLSFDGQTYTCKSTGVATCGNNQVLTFNGTSYFCVNKDASIPVCAANQFLTYNGSYQCAAVQSPAPLSVGCPSGQVLMGISNNQPVCVAAPKSVEDCTLAYSVQQYPYRTYGHTNKDGSWAGNDPNNVPLPGGMTQTTVPTGWHDGMAASGVGTANSCETFSAGVGQEYTACYTCVNGTWTGTPVGTFSQAY